MDRSLSTRDLREEFRKEFLYATGFANTIDHNEELRQLEFFVQTIELFISDSKAKEIISFRKKIAGFSEEEKADFWMWHYPIHWDDIFGSRIRQSFSILLCNHVETLLSDVAHRVQIIERQEFGLADLKSRSTRENAKTYFKRLADITEPTSELWKKIDYIFQIRNKFVHNNGYLGNVTDEHFLQFLKSISSNGLVNGFVELSIESSRKLLEIVEDFQTSLLTEFEVYRRSILAKEVSSKNS